MTSPLVFLDVETGGLDPRRHPVIQVAAVAVDSDFREVDAIEVKVRFDESRADPAALALSHYDSSVWAAAAVGPGDAVNAVRRFLLRYAAIQEVSAGRVRRLARVAGHQVAFDLAFLDELFGRVGVGRPWHRHALCTVALALWLMPGLKSYSLKALTERLGVVNERPHEALSDVRATVAVAAALARGSRPSRGRAGDSDAGRGGIG